MLRSTSCVTEKIFTPWTIRFVRILKSTLRHGLWGVFGNAGFALALPKYHMGKKGGARGSVNVQGCLAR